MNGLAYMLNLAGEALARANDEIAALRQRVAELEAQQQDKP